MIIADLRERLTIQEPTKSTATTGQVKSTWSDVATVWAEVTGLQGREAVNVTAVQSTSTHRIKIRYRSDVTSEHRFKQGTKVYNILGPPLPDKRKRELVCLAVETVED